jgi:predicted RNA binding protein YcfA (HicA-like mRNA interferase family)
MPPFGPVKRKVLIRSLRRLGFKGPESGGRHQHMIRGVVRVDIPNPHNGDIGRGLLATILKQAGVSRDEWESV